MGNSARGRLGREVIPTLRIALITLTIYATLYYTSLIILRPYSYFIMRTAETPLKPVHRPIINRTTVATFASSPFNAYEAVALHYNVWGYFGFSVVLPTIILLVACLTVYHLVARYMNAGKFIIPPSEYVIYSILIGLLNTYLVSAVFWAIYGIPAFGTSIYAETMYISIIAAPLYMLISITASLVRSPGLRNLNLPRQVAVWVLMGFIAVMLTFLILLSILAINETIPLTQTNHRMGLASATVLITAYAILRYRRTTTRAQQGRS